MSRNRTSRTFRAGLRLRLHAALLAGAAFLAVTGGAAVAQNARAQHAVTQQRGLFAPRAAQPKPNHAPQAVPKQMQNPAARPVPAPQAERQAEAPRPLLAAPQSVPQNEPRPNVVRPGAPGAPNGQLVTPNRPGQTQQHLAGWMQQHSSLPLAEQQRALESEPGFRGLPAQEQQQLHNRLAQLNSMSPEQRQKMLTRTETMEQLAPAQRQQVRGAMAAVGGLPEDRRHAVARAFYQLRDLPPGQRQAYMNSPQFRGQFNDQERGAINGLLNVAPIYPPLQGQQPR